MTAGVRRGLRLAASLGMIAAAAAYLVDWGRLVEDLRRFPLDLAAAAAAACALTLLLLSTRWWLMIRRFAPGGFLLHAGHFCMGTVAGLFTPAAVGADVYRVAALRGAETAGSSVAGVVVRERLIGLLGYSLFFLGCRAASPPPPDPLDAAAVALAVAAAGLAAVLGIGGGVGRRLADRLRRRPRAAAWGDRLAAVTAAASAGGATGFAASLGLTLAACAAWTAALGCLLAGLGERPGGAAVGMIGVLAELARWLPISIQGVGVREAVTAFGVERFGGDPADGFAAGALVYLLHAAVCALAGGAGAWAVGAKTGGAETDGSGRP